MAASAASAGTERRKVSAFSLVATSAIRLLPLHDWVQLRHHAMMLKSPGRLQSNRWRRKVKGGGGLK